MVATPNSLVSRSANSVSGSGTVEAKGGSGANGNGDNDGAGGAGGRIAFIVDTGSDNFAFDGVIDVDGAVRVANTPDADPGTFYTNATPSHVLCDTGDLSGTCSVTTNKDIAADFDITGAGDLILNTGVTLTSFNSGDNTRTISIGGTLDFDGNYHGDIEYLEATDVNFVGPFEGNIEDSNIDFVHVLASATLTADGRGFRSKN